MIDEIFKARSKKALQVTLNIPVDGGEPEIIDVKSPDENSEIDDGSLEAEEVDKEDEKSGLAPDLDAKADFLKGHEKDILRKKKAGIKPRGLDEKAMDGMLD